MKIPDGRGKQVAGCTLESFRERNRQREHFESVRLLYVAATRAKDRLILAGVQPLQGALHNGLGIFPLRAKAREHEYDRVVNVLRASHGYSLPCGTHRCGQSTGLSGRG